MTKEVKKSSAGWIRVTHPLSPLANPIEWVQLSTMQQAEKLRKLDCINYSSCLNYAAGLHWEGFVCIECRIYKEAKDEKI